jgi:60 kDa SS-A/Ro ribonucleoprotein
MGKFSKEINPNKVPDTEYVNYEGGITYQLSPKTELYSTIASYLVKEPKFYGNAQAELERVSHLVGELNVTDPEFVLKLAVFARNELYLRSAPIILLALAAKQSNKYVRQYVPAIVKRADEITEVLSLLQLYNENLGDESPKTMVPNGLRRGLSDVFSTFSYYQFSKYDHNKSKFSMQDAIRLIHPHPVDLEQEQLYKDIAAEALKPAKTWEHIISEEGSTKENWERVIPLMPIMATLRNLRNLLDKEIGYLQTQEVISKLTNEEKILSSKQFPFRFYSAYKSIEDHSNPAAGKFLTALNKSIEISVQNIPTLSGITAAFSDNSGSMTQQTISRESEIYPQDISNLFTAITSKVSHNNVIGLFAERFRTVNFADQDSIIARKQKLDKIDVGGSTNAFLALRYLNHNNIKVDRIFLFSDEQSYDSEARYGYRDEESSVIKEWTKYKKTHPKTYLYSVDLVGYGSMQVPEHDPRVLKVAGWNESIFRYIPHFEENKETVVNAIEKLKVGDYIR